MISPYSSQVPWQQAFAALADFVAESKVSRNGTSLT
jgi:hypothetical protein